MRTTRFTRKIWCLLALMSIVCLDLSAQTQWLDVTDQYVVNPRFDGNDRTTGWSGDAFGAANPAENAEHYQRNYDSYQMIAGLTPGRYRVSLNAFYRMGSADEDYRRYTNGESEYYQYAKLYATSTAGDYEVAIAPASSGARSSSLGGTPQRVGTNGTYRYIPNDMWAAYYWFNNGYYSNSVECEVGSDGMLRIGIRKYTTLGGDWTCLDDWKLEYYGTLVRATGVSMESSLTLNVSETYQLNAVISPANVTYRTLKWTSTNTGVVTVDDKGFVKAVGSGTATVKATTTDGSNQSASCQVRVIRNNPTSSSVIINEICAANIDVYRDPSTNFGPWVELYNPTDQTVVLGGMYVSDDPANLKKHRLLEGYGVLPAHGYAILNYDHFEVWKPASYRQIDDKLNVEGGVVILSDGINIIAQQSYPQAIGRTSYARVSDGGPVWGIASSPTPLASNAEGRFATTQLDAPVVDKDGQFFQNTLSARVTIPAGCTLKYTTDGTTPTWDNGSVSTNGVFRISGTTTYRFRLFRDGYIPSEVVTRSYITGSYPFPAISVVTASENIYSQEYGLFMAGDNGRPGNGQSGNCNWNMDWDRPVSMEFINTDNAYLLSQECDMAMCGGWSRAWSPHSFKLKAGKQYNLQNAFQAWLFKEKPFLKEKTLQIRNGGNDTGCRIKDAALQQIAARSGLYVDYQAWQPVHVFLNGSHYAVLNMREPNNNQYAYANYGIDSDEMDQFEMSPDSGYVQMRGTDESFKRLVDLSYEAYNPSVYTEICRLIDVDEYINYMAVELYLGGTDWPQNNVKGFRDANDGKFHFVLFDLDGTFATTNSFNSFFSREYYTFDPLFGYNYSTETSITGTRNSRHIEFVTLFGNMLSNETFRKQFIDAFCVVAAAVYNPDKAKEIVTEMSNYLGTGGYVNPSNTANQLINSLSAWRINEMTNTLKNYSLMGLSGVDRQQVKLSSNIQDATLMVNDMKVPYSYMDGYLFAPVKFKAIAPAGYRFDGWYSASGGGQTQSQTLISKGSSWRYYDSGSLDNTDWKSASFNDKSWSAGKAPLGYGKSDVVTTTSGYKTCYYFRTSFTLASAPAEDQQFILDYVIDDGMVVYVNGVEAGRYNMPAGTTSYNTLATSYAVDNPDRGQMQLSASLFKAGTNVIAIEVHNNSTSSSDILLDASLTTTVSTGSYVSTDAIYEMPESGSVSLVAMFSRLDDDARTRQGITPIRINEISAGNDFNVNEHFKKEDWAELYNTTDADIDVAGMYLSDNARSTQKYQIPVSASVNTVVPAHGSIVVWMDELPSVSQLHVPFKLDNSDGSCVTIQSSDGTWADCLEYKEQPRWHTFGRYPDGASFNGLMSVPSIGKANVWTQSDVMLSDPFAWTDVERTVVLELTKGWNWMSHNMKESVDRSRLTGYAQHVKSQRQDLYKDEKLGWVGDLPSLDATQAYKVKMNQTADVILHGEIFDTERSVSVSKGWNWIGFPLYNATNISVALQHYQATDGDQILGFDQLATYQDGSWTGTLTSLRPGQGYMLRSAMAQSFCWKDMSPLMQMRKRYAAPMPTTLSPWQMDAHQFPEVMGMIARVEIDGTEVMDGSYRIGAFWGDECRGVSEMCDGRLFMNIHGNGDEKLTFRLMDQEGGEFPLRETVNMQGLSVLGTMSNPYLLTFSTSDVTGLGAVSLAGDVVSTEYYSLSGQRIQHPTAICVKKTVYEDGRVVTKKITNY